MSEEIKTEQEKLGKGATFREQVAADTVNISQGGANRVEAKTVTVDKGAIQQAHAEEIRVHQSAILKAKADSIHISEGSVAWAIATNEVTLQHSAVGILLAHEVKGDMRVLIDQNGAAIIGLVAGAVIGLLRILFGRKRD